MDSLADLDGVEGLEGVGSGFAASRDGIDALLRDRGLRRTSADLTTESVLRGAHASGLLAGSASSLDEVRAGEGDAIAQAALRISVELLGLAPVFSRTPLQALARIHTLAAAGSVPADEVGRPKDQDSSRRLRDVVVILDGKRPALMNAALVHAELVTREPFGSYDGLVARAAERLVLVASGLDAKSLVVPEAGHLRLRREYGSNLRAYASGTRSGLQAWLIYCTEAYAAAGEASPLND